MIYAILSARFDIIHLYLCKLLPSVQTMVDYFTLIGYNFEYCWRPILNLILKWKVKDNFGSCTCGRSNLHFLSTWEVSDFQNLSYMEGISIPLLLKICYFKSRYFGPESRKVTFYLAGLYTGLCTCVLDDLSLLNIIEQNMNK